MGRFKNKKINLGWSIVVLIFIFCALNSSNQVSAADNEYQVLAPLPGVAEKAGDTTTLEKYVPAIFKLAIGLAAVFAVLMIVLGGIQYMSTDAFQKKEDGKNRVWNAVKGLVLVIAAYLILYTINPKLLEFDLSISPVKVEAPAGVRALTSGSPWVNLTQAQIDESNATREALEQKGVMTSNSPCTTEGVSTNCVNLNDLSENIKNGVISLKGACSGCNVTITAGTEGGHSINSLHNTGEAVDLRNDPDLLEFIVVNAIDDAEFTEYGKRYTLNLGGQTVYFLDEGTHWHVSTSEDHD